MHSQEVTIISTACSRAKAAHGQKASGLVSLLEEGCISVVVASAQNLAYVQFKDAELLALSMENVSFCSPTCYCQALYMHV